MLKFLDLAVYMVDIDGEPTDVEKKVLTKMIAELDQVKDEYTFRKTDTVENTINFFKFDHILTPFLKFELIITQ